MKYSQASFARSALGGRRFGVWVWHALLLSQLATVVNSGCDQTQKSPPRPAFPADKEWIQLRGVADTDAPNEVLHDWLTYRTAEDAEIVSIDAAGLKKLESAKHFDGRLYRLDHKFEKAVSEAPQLQWLCVGRGATAHDLQWICRLKNLRGLSLRYARLKDANLQLLQNLENLQWLDLTGAELPLAEVSRLPRLPKLEVLWVTALAVDSRHEHFNTIGQFPRLRVLSAGDLWLTDAELPDLIQAHPGLRYLVLGYTRTTSHTLLEFANLKDLRYLQLSPTPRQFQEMPNLQRHLPNCYLDFGD